MKGINANSVQSIVFCCSMVFDKSKKESSLLLPN